MKTNKVLFQILVAVFSMCIFLCACNNNNKERQTLFEAAFAGDIDGVRLSLRSGQDPNIYESLHGWTPLMQACAKGYTEIARMLLQAGANPNAQKFSGDKETALMYASQRGHEEIVKLLLEAKADPNIKNESGKTALAMAERNGFAEISNILKENGAK